MTPELLNQFAAIVGEKHAIRDAAGMAGYMTEWREIWVGKSPLVMRPGEHGRSFAHPETRQRNGNGDCSAIRQYGAGGRADSF